MDGRRYTLGEPSKLIRWNDPPPIGVSGDAVCECGDDALYHTIRMSGVLGRCHGSRWLIRRCPCQQFQLRRK